MRALSPARTLFPATLSSPPIRRFLPALVVTLGLLPWGVLLFTVLTAGLLIGGVLLITVAGVPTLAGTLQLARRAGALECRVLQWATGRETHRPAPIDAAVTRLARPATIRDASAWHDLAKLLLRLPVGVVSFALTTVLLAVPLAYLTAPLTYRWGSMWTLTGEVTTWPQALLAVPQGALAAALVSFAVPAAARQLSRWG